MERTIKTATQSKQVKRLQAELELERLRQVQNKLFSDAEEADFTYIWNSFNREFSFYLKVTNKSTVKITEYVLKSNCQDIVSKLIDIDSVDYSQIKLESYVNKLAIKFIGHDNIDYQNLYSYKIEYMVNIAKDLLTYGLIESYKEEQRNFTTIIDVCFNINYMYTPKMHRFKYWLSYSNLIKIAINLTDSQ